MRKNPLFTGALGTYNGCILRESFRIPQGVRPFERVLQSPPHAEQCFAARRQQPQRSARDAKEQLRLVQADVDYGNKLGVKAGCISGLKKSVYNSTDFGAVVMSSKATAGNVS